MPYAKIESNYVREKIKKTSWKKRAYIDDLMRIEHLALEGTLSWPTGYIRQHLEETYPAEWKAIWLELNPRLYNGILKRREEKETTEPTPKEDTEAYKEWKSMGGRG